MGTPEGIDAETIWEGKVEKNHIEVAVGDALESARQPTDVCDLGPEALCPLELGTDQGSVVGAVLDQEHPHQL
jgi:hypothetical protein